MTANILFLNMILGCLGRAFPWNIRLIFITPPINPGRYRQLNTIAFVRFSTSSSPVIRPDSTEQVTVKYRAPRQSGDDDYRTVRVRFAENGTPVVVLGVRASARAELTVYPRQATIRGNPGERSLGSFEVHNFSEHDWDSIDVKCSGEWFTAEVLAIPADARSSRLQPRQKWRVAYTVQTSELPLGMYEEKVQIAGKGTSDSQNEFELVVQVETPVAAIPSQFFFGVVASGEKAESTVTVHFRHEADIPLGPQSVSVRHSLPDGFQTQWRKTDGKNWELVGIFDAGSDVGTVRGKVEIDFPENDRLSKVVIPILAIVKEKS